MSSVILDPTALPGFKRCHPTPMRRTVVQDIDSGKEARVGKWLTQRWRYELEFELLRSSTSFLEWQRILTLFTRHAGQLDNFLFKVPDDNAVSDHGFGVGDGAKTKFPLQRTPLGQWQDVLGTWDAYTKPRTNHVLHSQARDNAVWTKGASTVTANAAIAPDGTLTADKIVESATAGTPHSIDQTTGLSVTIGDAVTYTGYYRAGERTQVQVRFLGTGAFLPATSFVIIDLTTGALVGSVVGLDSYSTRSLGGGWWEITITDTATASGAVAVTERMCVAGSNTYDGDGSSGLYAWQGQLERGTAATYPIPTTTAAVRADPAYWTADQTTGALVAPGTPDGFEPVTEPDWASVTILKDGVAQAVGTAFTFTPAGLVTFAAAPAAGAALSWTGSYFRRVRLNDDEPQLEWILPGYYRGSLELLSVI